jgi:hypothetical protein
MLLVINTIDKLKKSKNKKKFTYASFERINEDGTDYLVRIRLYVGKITKRVFVTYLPLGDKIDE